MARPVSLRLFVCLLGGLLALSLPPAVRAGDDFDATTRSAIRDVISRQLAAFAHDDGTAAEGFAVPQIKSKFPQPGQFLAMVKRNYPALIHPKRTAFGELVASPHGPLQALVVVDADGAVWNAVYVMAHVEAGWRILGCVIAKDAGQQDI
jgi:hypothetical protein